ncbi:Hypothetical protein RMHFA_05746 [Roseomonas mucosa]|uniref:hypothetical protein n=1 Tax=Roseomonas TaxID=125216 RepID=UPI000C194DA4|nr:MULTISPECIES: hypothetical protein [Roseomonas]MBS5905464.1 hypothetical protein [Acetobacteraceae bacterium]HWL81665.1 hypothetical protein [Roseomonas sp.]ATR20198.1 hypothetical protein CTJ15_07735 [Roseomonas sp. FDAARGOS_362]MDT8291471.1 hypothetical protein [Roseomonas mucosa]MDT8312514.1 hypothetical protein [Roseomonas mucosa]
MPQARASAAEYDRRLANAEAILDRRVATWRAEPASPAGLLAAGGTLAGLLGTAAIVGFACGGPAGALVAPVLVTLPAIMIAGTAGDLDQDVQAFRASRRAAALA